MEDKTFVTMALPPMPYYITTGLSTFAVGDQHPNRRNLGVFDLIGVIQGTLYIGEERRQWSVAAGQTLLLLPDRYHYAVQPCDSETMFYWVHFEYKGEWSLESSASAGYSGAPVGQTWENPHTVRIPQYGAPADFGLTEQLMRTLSACSDQSRPSAYWKEQQLFVELLGMLEERPEENGSAAPAAALADKTEAYLRQHYQAEITNGSLAEALHFHPNYIVRCMKAVYRCSPMEYLHRYRMEQAKLLLIKTELPIARIAEQAGFQNAPYFSNCFKQYAGVSPLRFRKRFSP
jgi:AraC-like DNA-binding protein